MPDTEREEPVCEVLDSVSLDIGGKCRNSVLWMLKAHCRAVLDAADAATLDSDGRLGKNDVQVIERRRAELVGYSTASPIAPARMLIPWIITRVAG